MKRLFYWLILFGSVLAIEGAAGSKTLHLGPWAMVGSHSAKVLSASTCFQRLGALLAGGRKWVKPLQVGLIVRHVNCGRSFAANNGLAGTVDIIAVLRSGRNSKLAEPSTSFMGEPGQQSFFQTGPNRQLSFFRTVRRSPFAMRGLYPKSPALLTSDYQSFAHLRLCSANLGRRA